MRRNLVARGTRFVRQGVLHLLVEQAKLLLNQIDLPLLADHRLVERFDQVLGESEFGYDFGQAGVCPSRKAVG